MEKYLDGDNDDEDYYLDHDNDIHNDYDDSSSEDEPSEDNGEFGDERLYRCTAKYKGGICCKEVFEDFGAMITHLWMTHGTLKSLFQVFILNHAKNK